MEKDEIRKKVREGYGRVARINTSCCGPQGSGCCGGTSTAREVSRDVGYTDNDMDSVPDGANLGLGCGNPVALASLKEGEVVLDLGSGAGLDSFLAARRVGGSGKIIGVDMTPEMLERARENAVKGGFRNVEFRLGEIENLPVADNHVDIIISNCVINLSPEKERVFEEAYRVLKPGGRLMVSDIVLLKELPSKVRQSTAAYIGCLAGAIIKEQYLDAIKKAGFRDVKVLEESHFNLCYSPDNPVAGSVFGGENISKGDLEVLDGAVRSIRVSAVK